MPCVDISLSNPFLRCHLLMSDVITGCHCFVSARGRGGGWDQTIRQIPGIVQTLDTRHQGRHVGGDVHLNITSWQNCHCVISTLIQIIVSVKTSIHNVILSEQSQSLTQSTPLAWSQHRVSSLSRAGSCYHTSTRPTHVNWGEDILSWRIHQSLIIHTSTGERTS